MGWGGMEWGAQLSHVVDIGIVESVRCMAVMRDKRFDMSRKQ